MTAFEDLENAEFSNAKPSRGRPRLDEPVRRGGARTVARLLDVWFHLELDLAGAGAPPFEMHWTALASILQQQVPARGGSAPPQTTISHWLTFDQENAGSIMSCLSLPSAQRPQHPRHN